MNIWAVSAENKKHIFYLTFLFLIICGKLSAVEIKTAFWIAGIKGGVFDEATVRTMAKTSSDWIVLNFPTNGVNPGDGYDMAANQQRIRDIKPSLYTLNYCNKICGGDDQIKITWPTLGKTVFYTLPRVKDYSSGIVITNGQGGSYGDFAKTNYTAWFTGKVLSMITNMGADGVAFDLSMGRDPVCWSLLVNKATNDPAWRTNYIAGFDKATKDVHDILGTNGIVLYNGLNYARSSTGGAPDEYMWQQSQMHLLSNYADGAIFEFFGLRVHDNGFIATNSFAEILTQVDAMIDMNTLGKHLMVFARGPKTYNTYARDYDWQRYLFCCYLLGAYNNHSFKYISSFQTTPSGGRSEGLDMYADQYYMQSNYLGSAGAYSKLTAPAASSGLYQRVFSKGIVLVHPHDSGLSSRTYYVSGVKYDRTGNTYSNCNVTLSAGTGILLTDDKLSLNVIGRYIDFEWTNSAGKHPVEMWSNATVFVSGTNKILQCSATTNEWMHDLMIFPVKHYMHADDLQIRTYFRDSNAKILALCEVDDSQGTNSFVVFTITPGATLGTDVTSDPRIIFRTPNTVSPSLTDNIPGAIYDTSSSNLYQTVSINANDRFDAVAPRYTYKRWVFIRIIGNANINWIQVGDSKLYDDGVYYYSE